MKTLFFNKRRQTLRIFIHFVLLLNPLQIKSCSFKASGENAAHELGLHMEKVSSNISGAVVTSAEELSGNINNAVKSLENVSKFVGKESAIAIRQVSIDLLSVSKNLTSSIDKGVEELSGVLREAIQTVRSIMERLTLSLDKAVVEAGSQAKNAMDTIKETINNLSDSLDRNTKELSESFRYISDRMVDISKQFKVHIDSGDLVGVSEATKEALIESVDKLTKNWKVVVDSRDLKGIAEELSKAMQNIKAHIKVDIGIDDNLRKVFLYLSITFGIGFSVCCVAIVISLKSCRKCIVNIWMAIAKRTIEAESEKSVELNNITEERDDSKLDVEAGWMERERKVFDKRFTKSFENYDRYAKIRNMWESNSRQTHEKL